MLVELLYGVLQTCNLLWLLVHLFNSKLLETDIQESINKLQTSKNIIIEDSPFGIEAGVESGEFVIAIDRGVFTEKQLSKANLVVTKITPEIILDASESL